MMHLNLTSIKQKIAPYHNYIIAGLIIIGVLLFWYGTAKFLNWLHDVNYQHQQTTDKTAANTAEAKADQHEANANVAANTVKELEKMKQALRRNVQTSKRYYLIANSKAMSPVKGLTQHLMSMSVCLCLIMTLMMTSLGQTVTVQQQPLTLTESKKLLRAALDREKILLDQRDAALAHIKNLDREINAATGAAAVDNKLIENLQAQKSTLQVEILEIRAALEEQRKATDSLRTALERAEQEVVRQKAKVKAANRRTWLGILGGVVVGVLAGVAVRR